MRVVLPVAFAALVAVAAAAGSGTHGTIVFAADRAPTLAGDVMRISPAGKARSLSWSFAADTAPAVSPNGKLVAFSSVRGGRVAEYVVRVDGKGLRRISPLLGSSDPNVGPMLTAAWSSDSASIAVLVSPYAPGSSRIFLASPRGRVWRPLTRASDAATRMVGWSPKGRVAYVAGTSGSVRVIDSRGKVLLDTAGEDAWWSPSGRLAVKRSTDVMQVFDSRLRRVATVPGDDASWSRADTLATVTTAGMLALRPLGAGRPTLTVRVGRGEPLVQWIGPRRLRYFGDDGWVLVDARTGHTFLAAGAFALFGSAVTADGTVAIGERDDRGTATLLRTRLGGSTTRLASTDACGAEGSAWENLQLLPDGSAVYDTAFCLVSSDIWSVGGAGGAPVQLTRTPQDETEPALSPDGAHIAYSAKATGNKCDGCDETLWVMNADGTDARSFPNSADPNVNYDDSPTFSPDGATIMFARSGPNAARLYTVPLAGGPPKALGVEGLAPVWGPAKVAYENLRDGVGLVDPDGTHVTPLHFYGTPAWSPSGRLAVLRSSSRGALSVYFADTKTSIPLPGFRASYRGTGLAWSPDGTRLAFDAVDREWIGDVWTIGADGKGLTRVTHDLGAVGTLSWR